MEKISVLDFCEKLVDHITVIEGLLQLNIEKERLEREVTDLKQTILNYIDSLNA